MLKKLPIPSPEAHQILIRITACGVCRTDLHIVDGELPQPKLPLIPGPEIVGRVVQIGAQVERLRPGRIADAAVLSTGTGLGSEK